jgi:hypothetical protein
VVAVGAAAGCSRPLRALRVDFGNSEGAPLC